MLQGVNQSEMRTKNRGLVLKQISACPGISRAEIATRTGLTKTTISNVIQELLQQGYVYEEKNTDLNTSSGRPPIRLYISKQSPLVCGMLLKRTAATVFLGTLSNEIIDEISQPMTPNQIDPQGLLIFLLNSYKKLVARNKNVSILGVGISCIGVLDSINGVILNPPNFFSQPCEFPLVELLAKEIPEPIFLSHDCSASILAQQLYASEETTDSFAYLCLTGGIGMGFILNGQAYNGLSGQSGEFGHCSIDYQGEKCVCGNRGCLELYANEDRLIKTLQSYNESFPNHKLIKKNNLKLVDFIEEASKSDVLCTLLLNQYTDYLATALISVINILDIDQVVLEYDGTEPTLFLEALLEQKLNQRLLTSNYKNISVTRSKFENNLSLFGCIAIVSSKVFQGQLG